MKKYFTFFLLIFISFGAIKAQNPSPPVSFDIFTEILNSPNQLTIADLLAGNVALNNDSASYQLKTAVVLLDTLNINKIHVSIARDSLNGSNLYSQVIFFDSLINQSVTLIDLNTTQNYRNKNIIYLKTDTLFGLGSIYGAVYLEDRSGNISTTSLFQAN